jgi:hypothetical protein
MSGQSPLKAKPLRLPGESVDKEIDRWTNDATLGPLFGAGSFCIVAFFEWYGYLTQTPRQPIVFTVIAVAALLYASWRYRIIRKQVRQLRQGRDGERAVGQFLERLREGGAQVFHDIPGDGPAAAFNLDHVVISTHGIYAIETKTWSKPWPQAKVVVEGDALKIAGEVPDRNPMCKSPPRRSGSRRNCTNPLESVSLPGASSFFQGGSWSSEVPQGMCGFWSLKCCQG